MALNAKQLRFADLYQQSVAAGKPNATQAYIEAGYKARGHSAESAAGRLLSHVEVQQLLLPAQQKAEVARAEQVHSIQASAATALERFWAIATADPNELIELRRTCCRYCYGRDNLYQRTRGEMDRDRSAHEAKAARAKAKETPEPFGELGGTDYDPRKPPNPKCEECFGEGVERVFPKDTRDLSPAARCLYAGVKVTKDGLEIKMHDQQAALVNAAKMLGAFEPKGDGKDGAGNTTNVNVTVTAGVISLTAADLDAAEQLAPLAGRDVHPHDRPQPLPAAPPAPAAAPVPAPG